MTITYVYENSLYVNITNRCPNRCDFCVRTTADGYYSDSLWLEREPSKEEILLDIKNQDPDKFDSLVFCGYGEPTERLDDMLWVCDGVRKISNVKIRLNTNGLSDLINKRDTAPEFEGRFDTVSISLNAATAHEYDSICHSIYGERAFDAMLRFATNVKNYVQNTILSVVKTTIPDSDIEVCEKIAEKIGVTLRVRDFITNK